LQDRNPPLTISWTPPAFTVGNYFINVYVNGIVQGGPTTTSSTSVIVNGIGVNTNHPIRAEVRAAKSGGDLLTIGSSPDYYWATPSNLLCTATRELGGYVTDITSTWTNPYGTYASVTAELWQNAVGIDVTLDTKIFNPIASSYTWPGSYPDTNVSGDHYNYYYILTYSSWVGYVATGRSNDA